MKILHLLSQRPEITGSGVYLQNIINQAKNRGCSNYLLAGIPLDHKPYLENIDKGSCRFVTFSGGDLDFPLPGMSDVMPYVSSRFQDLQESQILAYEKAFTRAITEAVRVFKPDIIHSHHLWLVTATAKNVFPDIPFVTSCHSTDLRQFILCPHLGERVVPGCRKVERILSLNRAQAGTITSMYGIDDNHIDVVGGGFDATIFSWQAKKAQSPIQILYAGKLSFAKGVDWLLRTLSPMKGLPFHLHLAGSGSGREEAECLKLSENLQAKVTVHGRISQKRLARLMAECHLFILPSFFEGLPLVLLEALASGCRVIATDLPGCLELLGGADADLVEWIQLPDMDLVDQPRPEDRHRLELVLAGSIERMMQRIEKNPTPERDAVEKLVTPHTWEAVFQRIYRAYTILLPH